MMRLKEHFDTGSLIIIVVTLGLFIVALFIKGFTHDLLLEAGVFLVSLKLIVMSYKNSVTSQQLLSELREIRKAVDKDQQD